MRVSDHRSRDADVCCEQMFVRQRLHDLNIAVQSSLIPIMSLICSSVPEVRTFQSSSLISDLNSLQIISFGCIM